MARQEAPTLLISRRNILKAGLGTAAALSLSVAGLAGFETYNHDSKESPVTERDKNLATAVELMASYDHYLVKDAVEFYRNDQGRFVNFIDSGFSKEPARVTIYPGNKGRELRIVLFYGQFADEQFQAQKAAVSLFEAFYVYQNAKQNVKRFNLYEGYKRSLELKAENIASQIFSEN